MYDCEAEWMAIAEFMAVECGYGIKGRGLLSPVLDLPELERDLRHKMAFVIIPERPRLH
jgi:hypothetical protein